MIDWDKVSVNAIHLCDGTTKLEVTCDICYESKLDYSIETNLDRTFFYTSEDEVTLKNIMRATREHNRKYHP
jgi:hypothetical protein